ncbi:putative amidotransferase NDAI_0G02610 [Naumovozyma dairenensis CBS 421]|uniref:Glutamine amidotransferase domain-containing protein n=1 Tax=Naumovozyma dairenensis (strain ATCC 10597 / BCRC 20456 / CBS 421 / NBRC 0211 / NRRL Y-12639) TaxID=1071378 RepID=G0WE27_NAUDC|nr:hypothetical protein NDAI_0G02610 [Naumovozyma dairenensis CBS 421]CCD26038.2 hypothetical protein NDAI_0G02610 [Naumovozyma dairenensis CBS 421]
MAQNKMNNKIAIFYTDEDAEWTHPHGNFVTMAQNLLENSKIDSTLETIEYQVFNIVQNEFPSFDSLHEFIGIFITGSKYDSFDSEIEWIINLRSFLKRLLSLENSKMMPPVVGICFGHQVIAAALGNKVDRNPKGLEAGVVEVKLNDMGQEIFGTDRPSLNLSMLHNDIAYEIPDGLSNWGGSDICDIQGFYLKNRILTFQGHPEFINDVAKKGVKRSYNTPGSKMREDQYIAMVNKCDTLTNDGYFVGQSIWKLFHGYI